MATTRVPNLQPQPNPTGIAQTFSTTGSIDLGSVFFQNLGTNGRNCSTCHQQGDGWTVTPPHVQARFEATNGTDPIFRPVDGAVCPTADVSTLEARRTAYAMLLTKGLIRVSIGVPAGAEFTVDIDDPYNCAMASALALFRRPLPGTNLRFLSTVMWDGRESLSGRSLHDNLASQAFDATMGHAQASTPPTPEQIEGIVALEMATTTAQIWDVNAGDLRARSAKGGPMPLTRQDFYIGINDPFGNNPSGAAFDPNAMTLYSAWASLASSPSDASTAARQAVARGEQIFNSRTIVISGVAGLNDKLGVAALNGTCTTCHDSPNVGDHSVPAPLNIGIADASRRTPDLPLYTLRRIATGEIVQVTDPGRALITGKWADIGKFKGPILRGLAARAPYFHNGSAATLREVVEFYDTRFNLGLSEQEKSDLVAFLQTL